MFTKPSNALDEVVVQQRIGEKKKSCAETGLL
jgi:hypothetical protein